MQGYKFIELLILKFEPHLNWVVFKVLDSLLYTVSRSSALRAQAPPMAVHCKLYSFLIVLLILIDYLKAYDNQGNVRGLDEFIP